jgi:D-amino-acid dehydrogenase
MYPMKGYSISVPVGDSTENAPTVSITDQAEKIVYSRLGDVLRAAGTAEFAGFNTEINRKRIRMLKRNAEKLFPKAGDLSQATEWACLRPQMPDGAALIGRCKYDNLLLNTGHGSLGWTLGPGTAKIVADIIDGKEPEISLDGMTADRY